MGRVNQARTRELGQPELIVTNDDPALFEVEDAEGVNKCERCGYTSFHEVYSKRRIRNIADILRLPSDRIITLKYLTISYLCERKDRCGKPFRKNVRFVEPNQTRTCRLERYLFERCLMESPREIEKDLDCAITDDTIMDAFLSVSHKMDRAAPQIWKAPRIMGMHFVRIRSRDILLVTNVCEECFVDFLEDASLSSIRSLRKRFEEPDSIIETIWVDLDARLIEHVKTVFPDAEIKVGKHQISRYLKRLICEVMQSPNMRKSGLKTNTFLKKKQDLSPVTSQKLNKVLHENKDLNTIYLIYQRVRIATKDEIETTLNVLTESYTPTSHEGLLLCEDAAQFKDLILSSYGDSMLNDQGHDIARFYYEQISEIINGYLEKTRNRSFEVMRARALYSDCGDLDEAFDRLNGEDEPKQTKNYSSTLQMYCKCVITNNLLMDSIHENLAVGFPFKEVLNRLQRYS